MVQFSLPLNSRVKAGKTWPKQGETKNRVDYNYRWNPQHVGDARLHHGAFRCAKGLVRTAD